MLRVYDTCPYVGVAMLVLPAHRAPLRETDLIRLRNRLGLFLVRLFFLGSRGLLLSHRFDHIRNRSPGRGLSRKRSLVRVGEELQELPESRGGGRHDVVVLSLLLGACGIVDPRLGFSLQH